MVQNWVLYGLIVSAVSVSALGAAFSVVGLGKLFAGASFAVWLMAGSLEIAKFTIAAFLHEVWGRLNLLYRVYLFIAVIVLSGITSLGIFGFLSSAYQESSAVLEAETIKLESLKAEQLRIEQEIARIIKNIDEIPTSRITRKMKARAEAEPLLADLRGKQDRIVADITHANLKLLSVKNHVGPLIYIAKMFSLDVDRVVQFLIIAFVFVFDPLAICLVIAVSESIRLQRTSTTSLRSGVPRPEFQSGGASVATEAGGAVTVPSHEEPAANPLVAGSDVVATSSPQKIIKMRFSQEPDGKA